MNLPSDHNKENEIKGYNTAKRILDKVYGAQVEYFLFGVHPDKF